MRVTRVKCEVERPMIVSGVACDGGDRTSASMVILRVRAPAGGASRRRRSLNLRDRGEVLGELFGGPGAAFGLLVLPWALHDLVDADARSRDREHDAAHVFREVAREVHVR